MKLLKLFIALTFFAFNTSAQRQANLKIDYTSLSDTTIVQNSGAINMSSVITHMGGDTLKANDTIRLSLYSNNLLIPFSNGTTIDTYLYYQRTMIPGDTMQLNLPPVYINIPHGWYNNCLKVDIMNASDTVYDTLQSNNTTCTQLQVLPVSISKIQFEKNTYLYPNPTTNNTNISINLTQAETISAIVTDITGKTVLQTQPTLYSKGKNNINLNTSTLPNATYIVNLKEQQGKLLWSSKLIKN